MRSNNDMCGINEMLNKKFRSNSLKDLLLLVD
ncbi:hypothetical protein T01_10171 [Trichinella spiralis]|uniref:Uncharacterized protein n=1 Tax=Trichinella spiralis TaxID=6334 RepID=A0A0V0Z1H9_TRISP|nr:hypothetical protein T01_10171 [Trichinella spiralis]